MKVILLVLFSFGHGQATTTLHYDTMPDCLVAARALHDVYREELSGRITVKCIDPNGATVDVGG
jgi:hypothetical protein